MCGESSDPGSKNNDARLAEATKIDLRYNWLKALRSGEYTQGYGALFRNGGYCCLGVACVANGFEFKGSTEAGMVLRIGDLEASSFLPPTLSDKLGLTDINVRDLVFRNDTLHQGFDKIANYLQELWRKEWIAALRSGKFKQAKQGLELRKGKEIVGHCCLGVACKINDIPLDHYSSMSAVEDQAIYESEDLKIATKLFVSEKISYILDLQGIEDDLVDMNDTEGQTFAEIADYLEQTWFPGEVSNVREPDAEKVGGCNGTGASINS